MNEKPDKKEITEEELTPLNINPYSGEIEKAKSIKVTRQIEKINPDALAKYLEDIGWESSGTITPFSKVYHIIKKEQQAFLVVLPMDKELPGYNQSMYEAVSIIARAQDDTVEDFLDMLIGPVNVDTSTKIINDFLKEEENTSDTEEIPVCEAEEKEDCDKNIPFEEDDDIFYEDIKPGEIMGKGNPPRRYKLDNRPTHVLDGSKEEGNHVSSDTLHIGSPDFAPKNFSKEKFDEFYDDDFYEDKVIKEPKEENKAKKEKKEKKGKHAKEDGGISAGKIIVSGLIFGLLAGVAFQAVNIGAEYIPIKTNIEKSQTVKSGEAVDVSAVAESAMPSVVSITAAKDAVAQNIFGQQIKGEATSSGSGIIIGKSNLELYIVTNNHVVSGAKQISVGFVDGEAAVADVRGTDASMDIAILQINMNKLKNSTKKKIKTANIGKSKDLEVGETAIAIGNALGYGQSVTSGCISAVDRKIALTDGTMTLIQTDAAINPGNSGGALLNKNGELIGINNAKISSEEIEGMGYAIPIDSAMKTIEQIIETGKSIQKETAYLGIAGMTINDAYAKQFGMPTGVYIQGTEKGCSAEAAGIQPGDIIIEINGAEIATMEQVQAIITAHKPGETLDIKVKRLIDGTYAEKEFKAKLGKKTD